MQAAAPPYIIYIEAAAGRDAVRPSLSIDYSQQVSAYFYQPVAQRQQSVAAAGSNAIAFQSQHRLPTAEGVQASVPAHSVVYPYRSRSWKERIAPQSQHRPPTASVDYVIMATSHNPQRSRHSVTSRPWCPRKA